MVPLSVLDLSPVPEGADPAEALRNSRDLARHAEGWGYRRFWMAEHHNMAGIASAATAVALGFVAEGTSTIRIGAGGIMLPNHAPLVIAEQFGTLASLYPGRIDLGLGRAPGSDQVTMRAMRRDPMAAETFPRDVLELQHYFEPAEPGQAVRAVPGEGLRVPLWILGSSTFGARLAAALGLPYAFAAHFAPAQMRQAIEIYRREFQPSAQLAQPYLMLGLGIVAADTDAQARRLLTSVERQFVNLRRGMPGRLQPPIDDPRHAWEPQERFILEQTLSEYVVGGPDTLRRGLDAVLRAHKPDEILATSMIFDHGARLRSFEILAETARSLGAPAPAAALAC